MTKLPNNLGFQQDLFILAFDHRGSFQSKLFGVKGTPTPEETKLIASYKTLVWEGFQKAIQLGVPKSKAGVLCDEQFGTFVLNEAPKFGAMSACPAEKSGQDEFDFEFGKEFGAHIHKFNPTFVKVLVRMNTEGDSEMNMRQAARLKALSEYCHEHSRKYLFELLVPATPAQLAKCGGDSKKFDKEMRPKLMVDAIRELQKAGVEPDIWKLEGMETVEDCKLVAKQCLIDGRDKVGVVLLGRGENEEKVRHWLTEAAKVPAFIGFAVGRTIFWEPLKNFKEGKFTREQARDQIATSYKGFCDVWMKARA